MSPAGTPAISRSYLVCRRRGLVATSERYLSGYQTGAGRDLPPISLDAVLAAVAYIEGMGESRWKGPKVRRGQQ